MGEKFEVTGYDNEGRKVFHVIQRCRRASAAHTRWCCSCDICG
jgi:hypothetical protein